jgi:hypothetical protein
MSSEKDLLKKLDEFAYPSMKFQVPNYMNGSQRLFDTHSLDTMNNKLVPSTVLNSKMILTPDSMRPMKYTPVHCDLSHIIDKVKRRVSEKDSPASTETFKTSLSALNLPKGNSPNINKGSNL